MIDLQAALQQHLLDVAVTQGVPKVPGHGLDDQTGLEMSTLDVAAGLPLQLESEGVEDHRPAPDRSSTLGADA